ncbi:MAG: hypothetical protein ACOC1K_02570, partial [Nanoarchaeota archaeon]
MINSTEARRMSLEKQKEIIENNKDLIEEYLRFVENKIHSAIENGYTEVPVETNNYFVGQNDIIITKVISLLKCKGFSITWSKWRESILIAW